MFYSTFRFLLSQSEYLKIDLCHVMYGNTSALFTYPWKLEKWLLGNSLSFYDGLFDGEYVQKVLHVLYFQNH